MDDTALRRRVPWTMLPRTTRPLDDVSLGRRVPWTMRPLDDAALGRRISWTTRPLEDVSLDDVFLGRFAFLTDVSGPWIASTHLSGQVILG